MKPAFKINIDQVFIRSLEDLSTLRILRTAFNTTTYSLASIGVYTSPGSCTSPTTKRPPWPVSPWRQWANSLVVTSLSASWDTTDNTCRPKPRIPSTARSDDVRDVPVWLKPHLVVHRLWMSKFGWCRSPEICKRELTRHLSTNSKEQCLEWTTRSTALVNEKYTSKVGILPMAATPGDKTWDDTYVPKLGRLHFKSNTA